MENSTAGQFVYAGSFSPSLSPFPLSPSSRVRLHDVHSGFLAWGAVGWGVLKKKKAALQGAERNLLHPHLSLTHWSAFSLPLFFFEYILFSSFRVAMITFQVRLAIRKNGCCGNKSLGLEASRHSDRKTKYVKQKHFSHHRAIVRFLAHF